jgi:hypothetical protein
MIGTRYMLLPQHAPRRPACNMCKVGRPGCTNVVPDRHAALVVTHLCLKKPNIIIYSIINLPLLAYPINAIHMLSPPAKRKIMTSIASP